MSELRIFPSNMYSLDGRDENEKNSLLELAAEAGINITDELSFSVFKILTTSEPPQFGIRYRLNENLILRGSSDFDRVTRGVIEYEIRF